MPRNAIGRVHPGPTPQAGAVRHGEKAGEWIHLPASGREAPAPDWPASQPKPRSRRWRQLWAELWRLPQAVQWERSWQVLLVAEYVSLKILADRPKATGKLISEVRLREFELGLTHNGLLRNRWVIDAVPDEPIASDEPADEPSLLRDRFKAVS